MPWYTDQNGFQYYVDDDTGKVVTPVSQPEPTPTPTPEPTPEPPSGGDTWKPDFRPPEAGGPASGDPWEGMPGDYGGVGTFTPTPTNPKPPWEGSKGATDAGIPSYGTPEYQERAAEVATKELKTFETSDGQYDLAKIAEAGKASYLRPLGVSEDVIRKAEKYAEDKGAFTRAEKALADYKQGDNYDVARAVRDGKINALKAVGYTDQDIASAAQYLKNKDAYDTELAQFEKDNVKLPADKNHPDGTWITRDSFNSLPKGAQDLILKDGLEALNDYEAKGAVDASKLLPKDVLDVYNESGPEDKFAILKAYGAIPADTKYVKSDAQGNPVYQKGADMSEVVVSSNNFPLLVGDMVIPGFATVRHWNEMGTAEKAFSIAMDALILIPVVGAAGKGARATTAVTRMGRVGGALKGVGREAVAQLRAPVDVVLHPVQTVKGTVATGRDLIENVAHIRKLPEAVITTTNGTVRIPVSKVGSELDAAKAADRIMNEARRTSSDVIIEMNGQRYTLSRSALTKELGGGLAHATPQGEAFQEGLRVAAKPGMPTSEQGLFVANEPLPRFTSASAFGQTGAKPAIVIVAPDIAKDAISTEKIYHSAAGRVKELEMKFPVGYQLPAPSQRLFTRVGPNKIRVDILLVGYDKQLSPLQVAKLKSLAVVEDLKATVKPALRIEGRVPKGARAVEEGLSEAEVQRLARELRAAGNKDIADNLVRAYRAAYATTPRGRGRGDLVAIGSIRERGPAGTRRDSLVVTVSGTPERQVDRREPTGSPVAYRVGPGQVLPGRVEIPRDWQNTPKPRNPRERPPETEAPRPPGGEPLPREPQPPRPPDENSRPPRPPEPPRTDLDGWNTPPRIGRGGGGGDSNGPPRRGDYFDHGRNIEPPKQKRGKGMTDSEKRHLIAAADTKVTWQQGYLHGEPVHHVVLGKDGQFEKVTVVGAKPEGAISAKGKGQSYRTVTVAKGIPPDRPIKIEGGAVDPVVSPIPGKKGVEIRFVKDESVKREPKPNRMFKINRRSGSGRSINLGADIVRDRRGRHLRL